MIAIPAIDIMDGQCTRLLRGDFNRRTRYKANPLSQALAFEDAGLTRLHLVDLDGARKGRPLNLHILEKIAGQTSLQVDYGGGIRKPAHIAGALDAGAAQVNLGTLLFSSADMAGTLLQTFGSERLIASVDVRLGKVAVKGWQEQTGISAMQAIGQLFGQGWSWFSVTDTDRDGTLLGPDPAFYEPLTKAFPEARIIGGGGIGKAADLEVMQACGLYGAITGKAIFEGGILLSELKKYQTC